MTEAHDNFLIYLPDSTSRLPRLAWRYDAVVRAMDELGPGARVLRVTEGDYCRDCTEDFKFKIEAEIEEDDEATDRRWRQSLAKKHTFGTRSL